MAILEILTVPNPILKQSSTPVLGGVTDELRKLMDDMLETMYDAPGIGLAAIQVGQPLRIIVMDLKEKPEGSLEGSDDEGEGEKNPRFFVNPEIMWKSNDLAPYEEGCLSVPEVYDEVLRPTRIKIRYLNYQGQQVEEEADGLFATCFQHEMDHLDGVLFIDYLSKLKRDRAVSRVKKLRRL